MLAGFTAAPRTLAGTPLRSASIFRTTGFPADLTGARTDRVVFTAAPEALADDFEALADDFEAGGFTDETLAGAAFATGVLTVMLFAAGGFTDETLAGAAFATGVLTVALFAATDAEALTAGTFAADDRTTVVVLAVLAAWGLAAAAFKATAPADCDGRAVTARDRTPVEATAA